MEFLEALELMKAEKNCAIRNSILGACRPLCIKCELNHRDTDRIEAFQMAVFALEKLIEAEVDDGI